MTIRSTPPVARLEYGEVAVWRKSSRSGSGGNGDNCVEAGVISWRKSTRSGDGGNGANCVEAGVWRRSTRSSSGANGANCVEAADCRDHIAVRDSKLVTDSVDFPTLSLSSADWAGLVAAIKSDTLPA